MSNCSRKQKLFTSLTVRGFTIVELLIVVVVIAILATITVVAYNGITKRTQTTAYVAAADAIEKATTIAVINGENFEAFKDESSPMGSTIYSCIGSELDLPANNDFAAGECIKGTDTAPGFIPLALPSSVTTDSRVVEALRNSGALPRDINLPTVKHSSTIKGRGVAVAVSWSRSYKDSDGYYTYTTDPNVPFRLSVYMYWLPADASSCGRGAGLNQLNFGDIWRTGLEDAIAYRDGAMTRAEFMQKYPDATESMVDNINDTIRQIEFALNSSHDLCSRQLIGD